MKRLLAILFLLAATTPARAQWVDTHTFEGTGVGELIIRAPSLSDTNFSLTASPLETIVSGSTSTTSTVDDAVFSNYTSATIDTTARVNVQQEGGSFASLEFSSLDEAIATVASDGRVTRVASGTVGILARTPFLTRRVSVTCSRTTGTTSSQFSNFVTGSLARAMADAIDPLLVDGKTLTVFTRQDHTAGVYIRDANCWLAGVDTSGISPWNSQYGAKWGITAVGPRICIGSGHIPLANETIVRFVTMTGAVVNRTIASGTTVVGDLRVYVLDSDLPGTITPLSVWPASYLNNLGSLQSEAYFNPGPPIFAIDQQERAVVFELNHVYASGGFQFIGGAYPVTTARQAFSGTLVSGDSSSPICAKFGSSLVLLFPAFYGYNGTAGHSIANYLTELNAALSPRSLTQASLSGYPTY